MKNLTETIRKMVGYLNNPNINGGYWLPNIQRHFVWDEDQMERLFDSIMREYPISTLLVWKTNSRIRRRRFIDNYKHDLKVSDFYVPEDDKTKMLVLDGQQRLQSLFIGLKGSYEKKELYFDILSGEAAPPEDVRYQFRFFDNQPELPWVKFKDIVFDTAKYNQIANKYKDLFRTEITDKEKQTVDDNIAQIVKTFATDELLPYQEIDSIDNPNAYKEDDVVEIFIRANSGGTPLGKSDLLFSLLTSSWEVADEKMDELLEELNKTGFEFTRDFVLKTCLTIFDTGAAYNVRKFRDSTVKQKIIDNWGSIVDSIKFIKDYISGTTYIRSHKSLSSYLLLIPLIYFRYHHQDKWAGTQNIDGYILRTLLAGAFGGSPDSVIDKVVGEIKNTGSFDVNRIYVVIRSAGRSLEITKETILEEDYKSKYIHLIFNLWYKDFNYHPSFIDNKPQIDHIFPQTILKSVKYKQWDRDQIANLMLLTQEENGAGGKWDIMPEEWFENKSDVYLDMHLIPKNRELLKLDNYEDFIAERKELILQKFGYLILNEASPNSGPILTVVKSDDESDDVSSETISWEGGIKVKVEDVSINARSVSDLYLQVLRILIERDIINKIQVPYLTSAKRYLLAKQPYHPLGNPFRSSVNYKEFYMEAHKDYKNAINHLKAMLLSANIHFSL